MTVTVATDSIGIYHLTVVTTVPTFHNPLWHCYEVERVVQDAVVLGLLELLGLQQATVCTTLALI